jgi:hypothetical protein
METCNSEEKIDEESGMEGGPATSDSPGDRNDIIMG